MKKLFLASIFLLSVGCQSELPLVPVAQAQEAVPGNYPTSDIAGGTIVWGAGISCDNAGTTFFYHDSPGSPTDADLMLFPDESTLLVSNSTADTVATCCWVSDQADTIGDQTVATDLYDVGGAPGGSCFSVLGGAKEPHKWKFNAWATSTPSYNSGVCTGASTHTESDLFEAYKLCALDNDCASIAGHGGGSTCSTASAVLAGQRVRNRAVLLGCRCSAATTVRAELKR